MSKIINNTYFNNFVNKPTSPGKGNPQVTDSRIPKVSIVIPAYNREKYLGMAVRSVLDQTYRDLELIIVDDGSTDATLEIAEQFAREDDRVRVLTDSVNRGAAYALKTGFEAARSKYVGQVDSDDLLEARAIELTVKALDEHPDWGMVYTNYRDINQNGQLTSVGWRCSTPYSKEKLLEVFMTFHFRMIRKSVYQEVGGFNPDFDIIEDYELCMRLSEMTEIGKIDQFLYQYRHHPDALKATSRLEIILMAKKIIELALERRGMSETHRLNLQFNPMFSLEKI